MAKLKSTFRNMFLSLFTISFVVRGQQKADEVAAAMASKTAEAAL